MARDDSSDRMSLGSDGRGRPSSAFTGDASGRWNERAERFAELSRDLQEQDDVDATLKAIVQAATDTVPGAEHASISTLDKRRKVQTRAATGDLPREVDQAQYETGEGPGLDSLHERRTVRLDDVRAGTRWPVFAGRARELGVGSMLSIQLFAADRNVGSLNLLSARPDAFSDDSKEVGLLFAAHAAVALVGAQEQEDLRTAIDSRDVIGQAKGILMERHKINANEAFRMLVVTSQATNIKLTDVSDQLARTGQLPSPNP